MWWKTPKLKTSVNHVMTSNMTSLSIVPRVDFLLLALLDIGEKMAAVRSLLCLRRLKAVRLSFLGDITFKIFLSDRPWAHLWDWNIEKSPAHISKYILGIRLGRTGHWKRVRQELLNQIICQTPVRPSQGRHHLPRELISSTVQSSIKFYLTTQHLPKKGISKSRYSLFNWLIDLCFCYFKMTYL